MAQVTQDQVRQVATEGGARRYTLFALSNVSGNDTIDLAALGFFSRVYQASVLNCGAAPVGAPGVIDPATVALPSGLANDAAYLLVDGVPV